MRITMIGSGNVATHLCAALKNAGHCIVQVYSRNMHNAALLAYHVGARAINKTGDISGDTDIFILAIKDDAIPAFLPYLSDFGKLIVHTSGTVALQQTADIILRAGVFYPLQTFNKIKELNFKEVPLCIEGADDEITQLLEQLALTISNKVYRISSGQRKVLHLAAVFSCNFTNHFYTIAQQLLAEKELDFEMLRPLIIETAGKIKERLPHTVQTGPAVRGDTQTLETHLQMLAGKPVLQELYSLVSQDIIKNHSTGNGDK